LKGIRWFVWLGLLTWCSGAWGAGFNIYEMGARATAMGGAFVAAADDPSAIFYNPAGTAWLPPGFAASVNVSAISPETKFARATGVTESMYPGDPTAQTKSSIFTPTGIYVTYRKDEHWSGGIGFFTPFGLGVEWDKKETFAGRTLSTNSQIRGYYFSPMVTYHPVPQLAVSVGGHLVVSSLTLERIQTQIFGTDARAYNVIHFKLEGTSDLTVAPAAAVMWRPNGRVSFGINYKGAVTNSFTDQDGTLEQLPTGIDALDAAVSQQLDALGRKQKVSGDLNYPGILMVGTRVRPHPKLAVLADFVWFNWSVFDRVDLEFTNPALNSELREDYQDGQQWRLGLEFELRPGLDLLAGFVYDNTPQPVGSVSPLLPDANRFDYSLGVSYRTERWDLTAGYMLVDFEERSTVVDGVGYNYEGFDGTYDSIAHIGTLGFTVYF
jgi:long-chain fatty acid transport protein